MDCKTNYLPTKQHLAAMLRTAGTLAGLPIVAVSGHTENAITCQKQHLSFDDLLRASIGTDNCGKPAIRVKFIDSCDLKTTCKNNSDEDPLRNMFAYDSTTKTIALVINQSS